MNPAEKRLSTKRIYDGRVVKLDVDEVELSDGSHSRRECVRHSGGAAVLFVKDGKIALVKQFRYLYGREILEIPAGKLNEGEDPLVAAGRELEEETGYRPKNLQHLLDIYPTPGYTDEVIHIYFTDSADFVGQKLDPGEFLSNLFVPVEDVYKMISSGEINDSKTICAVYAYLLKK